MMEDLMMAVDCVNELTPIVKKMSYTAFGSMICMLIEEHARANDRPAPEIADELANMVHQVTDELGKY